MIDIDTARQWYPLSDPVHGFDHVLRVYFMAERLAVEEGADLEIVRAAALLHDAEGSATEGGEAGRLDHQFSSAEFARQVLQVEGWMEERIQQVEHCIRAHRFRDNREQPATLEARILFDADKLDAIGAIGVARAVAYAANDGQPVYAHTSQLFENTGQREPGESHSAYHEFVFKLRHLKDRLFTQSARVVAEERHRYMEEFYRRLASEMEGKM